MILKKLLAMTLAMVMAITTISVVYSADVKSENEVYYAEVISIMRDFGLTDKLPADNENNLVTREQFTASVLDLLGMTAMETECLLKDIQDSQYKASIQTAYQFGIAKGFDGFFRPGDIITMGEAATILVNALGYSQIGETPVKQAQKLGLFDGIRYAQEKELKVGEAVRMLYNAGNAVVTKSFYSKDDVTSYIGDKTVFEHYLGIYHGKGVLTANQFTTLKSDKGIGVNMVQIDDFMGRIYYNSDVFEFLGCKVGYYYKKASDGIYDVLKLYLLNSNDIIKVSTDDMVSYSKSGGTMSFVYYNNTRKETVKVSGNTPVIFNGSLTTDYTYTNASGEKVSIFQPDSGEITFIDNNNDGNTDIIHVLSLENVVVSTVNINDKIIYDKYDANKIIRFEDNENQDDTSWVIFDKNGEIIPIENLKEWNIISVARGRNGYSLRGICTAESVKGMISSVNKKGQYQIAVIDGKEYKIAKNFSPTGKKLTKGDTGTFYLDYTGKIAAAEFDIGKGKFGYYIDSRMDDTAFSNNGIALITNEQGIPTKMRLATKVKIDGNMKNGRDVVERLWTISGEINQIKSEAYRGMTLKGVQLTDGEDKRYPIVYMLNANNEINYIDTQIRGTNEDANTLHAKNVVLEAHAFIGATDTFGSAYALTENAVYMEIPDNGRWDEYDCYRVVQANNIPSAEKYVRGFSTDSESYLSEFIVGVSAEITTLSTTAPLLLIEDKYTSVDAEGELVDVLTGYTDDGAFKELVVPKDYVLKSSATTYGVYIDDVKPGDIIKYATNPVNQNEIVVMSKIYDGLSYELDKFLKISSTQTYMGSKWFADSGYLFSNSVSDGLLTMMSVYGDKINNADYSAYNGIEPSKPHFYKTKTNTTKVSKVKRLADGGVEIKNISADLNQLESYQVYKSKLKTFIYCRYENAKMLVQYEEE